MTSSLPILFAIVALLLISGGGRLSETGETAGERLSGLGAVVAGAGFAVLAIILAVIAMVPNL